MRNYFEFPLLLVLAPLCAVAAAWLLVLAARRRSARLTRFGAESVVSRLFPAGAARPVRGRGLLLAGAALMAGVALAGPRWGSNPERISTAGIDMVLALDASLSMLATDEAPSRLERMKQEVRRLRAASVGDRIGLIVFAGRSYILSPLTVDESALELFLDNLDPFVVGQGGSSLSSAIRQGTSLLVAAPSGADRALVVMTDGEAFDSTNDVAKASRAAADAGVSVVFVGFGSAKGSTIPVPTDSGVVEKRDEDGRVVVTQYHPEVLRAAADAADGTVIDAGETDKTTKIRRALASLKTRRQSYEAARDQSPRFQLLLIPMLLLLIADTVLTERRRHPRSPRRAAPSGAATTSLGVMLLLAAALAVPATARADDAADGARYYRGKRYTEAIAAYRRALTKDPDNPELLYDLGTALLAADSTAAAGVAFDRAEHAIDPARHANADEVRYRVLFNRGLANLQEGLAAQPGAGNQALDAALAAYKKVLLMRPADMDAKWNYELALRERQKGGGGGGGSSATPPSSSGGGGNQAQEQQPPGQVSRLEAEALLNSAQREERDVQEKRQDATRPARTVIGKDW